MGKHRLELSAIRMITKAWMMEGAADGMLFPEDPCDCCQVFSQFHSRYHSEFPKPFQSCK
jgi:hypothetical protein